MKSRAVLSYNIVMVLAMLTIPLILTAQEITPQEDSDWKVEEFTLPGGTNGNLVTAISEGPSGYMWFGSFAGLHRYDGHEIITYNDAGVDTSGTSTALTFPNIEHIFWDSNGQLWISTFGGGAFHFDPQKEIFTRYQHDPQDSTTINNDFVHGAAEDADGNLWFATRTGVSKLDQKTGTFKHYKTDPSKPYADQNNRVRALYLDKQGTLWATSGEVYAASLIGGLFRYDPAADAFEAYFPNPDEEGGLGYSPIHGLHEDSEGNFWVGTFYGLQKMDRRTGTFTDMTYGINQPYAPNVQNREDAPIWSIHEDQNKGIWMGTVSFTSNDKNVSRYDPVNQTTETFPISTMAWDIAESSDGTIWVAGSAIQGKVSRISRQKKKYNLQKGQEVVQRLNQLRRADQRGGGISLHNFNVDTKTNTLWAVRTASHSAGSGLATVYLASKDIASGNIKSTKFDIQVGENNNPGWANVGLEIDDEGNIWFTANYGGLIKYNPVTKEHQQFYPDAADSTSISSNDIVSMIRDSRNNIWAAGYRNGLNRINAQTGEIKRFNFYEYNEDYADPHANDNFPIAVLEGKDGSIWVGGALSIAGDSEFGAFLANIDPITDEIKYIDLPRVIKDNSIRFLTQDPITGNIAFSLFQQGFCVYEQETGEIKFYDAVDGQSPFTQLAALMYDNEGYLWLSALRKDEFARLDLSTGNVFRFETSGDINISSNNRYGIKTADGHILFKNNNGWADIDPLLIAPQEVIRTGSIKLVDLSVSGEKQNYLNHSSIDTIIGEVQSINLNHTAESFIVKFSDFNYSPNKSNYHYRLYPYEEKFRQATNGPIANYFKVPPGEYEFQVTASSSRGTIIEPLNIEVTINPPWWKTWWAYTLYGLGALFLGWSIIQSQRSRAIRLERERNREKELESARELEVAYNQLKASEKEAQIEVSLERVRAAAMAMHKTEDLKNVSRSLFDELKILETEVLVSYFSVIDKENETLDLWTHGYDEGIGDVQFTLPFDANPQIRSNMNDWLAGKKVIKYNFQDQAVNDWLDSFIYLTGNDKFNQFRGIDLVQNTECSNKYGLLGMSSSQLFSENDQVILQKFSYVFEQAYTRFLDIEKAEAQAREAQIEAALERVRSASMAMHASEELPNVLNVMFKEFAFFNNSDELRDIEIFLIDDQTADAIAWTADQNFQNSVTSYPFSFYITPSSKKEFIEWQKTPIQERINLLLKTVYEGQLWGKVLEDFDKAEELKEIADRFRSRGVKKWVTHHAFFSHGMVALQQESELNEEGIDILKRFTTVFEQTYTRFLDLQKAEAQAREAQIEAALETIRSRSLAMNNSEELGEVVKVVLAQLNKLNIENQGEATIFTYDEGSRDSICWLASDINSPIIKFSMVGLNKDFDSHIWDSRDRGDHFTTSVIRGKELKDYWNYLFNETDFKYVSEDRKQWILDQDVYSRSIAFSDHSAILIPTYTDKLLDEEQSKVLVRICGVFNQSYTRFLDLQKAEALAREAQIEVALEKVRSQSLSMVASDELSGVAHALFTELETLVPNLYMTYLSILSINETHYEIWNTKLGGAFQPNKLLLPKNESPQIDQIYEAWKSGLEVIKYDFHGDDASNYIDLLYQMSGDEMYKVDEYPNDLYNLEGSNQYGVVGIVTTNEATDEVEQIVKRFSYVFEQSLTRFLDLQKAEKQSQLIKEEKERLEKTLNDLKATQDQLIQSEKMASLGELTAGIAHEIQNPLNFVNNFSDVSGELIDEAVEELSSIDFDSAAFDSAQAPPILKSNQEKLNEAKEILGDLKGNLEKITHHGGRASSIVKGMLDHSRESSKKKVVTDINALCDEYLRLSYHGLRAKDKTFNSEFKTDFDENLPLIDVVPQDVGRVILNIINNAFYAVNERAKASARPLTPEGNPSHSNYKPLVTIKTQQINTSTNKHINISITDNGIGMSQETMDKVFQPFFTTKPTGSGTGLGMSISYDIITNGHGGEISVSSVEGQGSQFIIKLLGNP